MLWAVFGPGFCYSCAEVNGVMKKVMICKWESIPPHRVFGSEGLSDLSIRWPSFTDEANTDHLTGLPNRRAFDKTLEMVARLSGLQGAGFGLILLDIDHFKKVNDTYGHPAGDAVLKQFSELVRKAVRSDDMAARYGGEEFAVITPAFQIAFDIGERVRKAVENETFVLPDGKAIDLTCSFGCVAYPVDTNTVSQLIEMADKALYEAKINGRNGGAKCALLDSGGTKLC